MKTKVVTFGELLLRFSKLDHQRLSQGDYFTSKYGGSEANVAVSLATLGDNVQLLLTLENIEAYQRRRIHLTGENVMSEEVVEKTKLAEKDIPDYQFRNTEDRNMEFRALLQTILAKTDKEKHRRGSQGRKRPRPVRDKRTAHGQRGHTRDKPGFPRRRQTYGRSVISGSGTDAGWFFVRTLGYRTGHRASAAWQHDYVVPDACQGLRAADPA